MGRKRILNKKISQSFSLSPYTLKEMDEFVKDGSRSAFTEIAIIEKIRRERSEK